MKKEVILVLLILLIQNSFALYEEEIFNGWIESGKKFSIEGENYSVIYIPIENLTVIKYPGSFSDVIEKNETCTEGWIYRSCLLDTKFLLHGVEVPHDTHSNNLDISMELQIFASYSNIEIQKEVEKNNLLIGEPSKISVILNNTGKLDSDVYSIDTYSDEFIISNIQGECKLKNNNIIIEKLLKPEKYVKCNYLLKIQKNGTYENNISVNYTVLDRSKQKTESNTFNVIESAIIIEPLEYIIKTEPSENITFDFNITATQDLEVGQIILEFPEKIVVIDSNHEYRQSSHSMNWKGELKAGESQNFSINIKSDLIVNTTIKYRINYNFKERFDKKIEGTYLFESNQDLFYVGLVNISNTTKLRIVNPTKNIFKDLEIELFYLNQSAQKIIIDELGSLRFREYDIENTERYKIKYKTVFGQPLVISNKLTHIEITDKFENLTLEKDHKKEEKENAIEYDFDKNKEKKINFELFNLDFKTIIIVLIIVIISFIFTFLWSHKPKEDKLDKEIRKIRKEIESEEKDK